MPELVVYVTLRGDNVATYEWGGFRLPLEKDVDTGYKPPKGFSKKSPGSHLPTFLLATCLQDAKQVARFQFDSHELMVERAGNTPWSELHTCIEGLLSKVEGKKVRLVHHDEPGRLGLHGIDRSRKR